MREIHAVRTFDSVYSIASFMTHRRIHRLIWWLLPIFALRGMVPVGFMVNVSGGELSMTVCPMHQAAGAAHAKSAQSDTGRHDKKNSNTVCPFAAALTSATFVGMAAPTFAFVATDAVATTETAQSHVPFGPFRAQQSRAPPAFA